ncbi:Ribose operon repressor [Marinobacterium sp. xm-v-242]|nr:Ribose operon repressor [Marinobacterium sp. xm-v-242]NRP78074.1 Ribose operon repressor [Marinobacterium sp. xm-m-383]
MSKFFKAKITLADVAKLAGVSRSAVSRTFTPGASVSAKTRKLVEEAAASLGYRPNILARSLTTGQTGLVGLVANNFQNPAYLEIFDIFTRLLQEKGLRTLLVNLTDETDPQRSLDLLSQYQVDAVVVATSTLPVEFSSAFSQAGLPVVHAFGRDHQGDYDVVGIDNFSAGAMGAQRLLQAGYSDIGFLGGPQFSTSTNDRLNGFLSVVDSAPHVRKRVAFADAYTFEAGNKAMHGLIEGKLSQGYFCGDDMIAIGAISALEASRISVPEQVGIIGFNNIQMAGWENIQLTTISQPVTEIVEITVDRLLSQLEQGVGFKPCLTLLPCEIVERNSMPKL